VILKQGNLYVVSGMRDNYQQVYELLQDTEELENRNVGKASGRYTLIGLYSFYTLKELRLKQTEVWKYVMDNLADYPIDWYIRSSIDRQLVYNGLIAIILSLILLGIRRLLMSRLCKAKKEVDLKKK
jgi:hypothetical protein